MSPDWRRSVNQTFGPADDPNVQGYVVSGPAPHSPIDEFYTTTRDLLDIGQEPLLTAHHRLGPLLVVGLVSATENYLRDLFSQLIGICPVCKVHAATQSINLGSVVWHSGNTVERGAFEHLSFASGDNIKKTTLKFLGYKIQDNSPIDSALVQFEKICEFRHGIAHAGGILPGKNAIALGIPSSSGNLHIAVAYAELQECAAICTTFVATFNSELFEEIAKRWATKWRTMAGWEASKALARFKTIRKIFLSNVDDSDGTIPNPMTDVCCRNLVTKEFP